LSRWSCTARQEIDIHLRSDESPEACYSSDVLDHAAIAIYNISPLAPLV
jgi:hypothetical protein